MPVRGLLKVISDLHIFLSRSETSALGGIVQLKCIAIEEGPVWRQHWSAFSSQIGWVWQLTQFVGRKWRSGLNRIGHPDWVKLSVELNCAPNQNTKCSFSVHIYIYIYVCMYVCKHIYIYIYIYRERERERERGGLEVKKGKILKYHFYLICSIFEKKGDKFKFSWFAQLFNHFLKFKFSRIWVSKKQNDEESIIFLTPESNQKFFVYAIQGNEIKMAKKELFKEKWEWRIEQKPKISIFNCFRYSNLEGTHNINKKAHEWIVSPREKYVDTN